MVLKLFGQDADEAGEATRPRALRKVRPLAVRNADLLALRGARDARLPRPNALGATRPRDRAAENRAATPDKAPVLEPAPERRAN
jgi:hypothetical protein